MAKHVREVQCRFYVVLEGIGHVWVDAEQEETNKGTIIWVPSGHTH